MWPTEEVIRTREELAEQIRALSDLAEMGRRYGCDISRPAESAREAVQWTYLAYLGAIKEANGAAMSIGRISTFLDIYIERDMKRRRTLDEGGAQELIDQLVQKLRIVRFLRTPDYDALFSGDPYWATECIGGMTLDGRTLGHAHQLPHAAYAHQSWTGARAQHDGALVAQSAGGVQALLHHASAATPRRCSTRTTT